MAKPVIENKKILKRAFNDSTIERFCNDIKNEKWVKVYNETDANRCFNVFHEIFMLYFNKHFPITEYRLRQNKKWVTTEIRNSSVR